jgi:ATP-dependent RNA helicase DeaD
MEEAFLEVHVVKNTRSNITTPKGPKMDLLLEENAFQELGLKEEILSSLKKAGFTEPSPIQKEVIPIILSGADVIGQAQTGTGKTAAFGLPALQLLKNNGKVEVLVITPTRELTGQVSEELKKLGSGLKAKVATVYGGKSFQTQIDAIKKGVHIIVATPGRLLDLLGSGRAPGLKPSLVIVDEADEMLDMGFLEDIQAIFEHLPEERQTLMFSATMPPAIQNLAKKILKDPVIVKAASTQTSSVDITQSYCIVADSERDEAVIRLFEAEDMDKAILFCKTKKEVDRLSQVLNSRGHAASALHGDMEQNQRETVIYNFRSGKSRILVATDVAARGLNIIDVTHVINFNIPYDAENYVHRIGRTGRAGRKGASLTLVTPRELGKLLHFQQKAGGNFTRTYIPSKKDIRKSQVERLVSKVSKQSAPAETTEILNSIGNEEEVKAFAGKLLGLILSQNPINGPETIGVQEHEALEKKSKYAGAPRSMGRRRERSEREFRGERRDRGGNRSEGRDSRERPARSDRSDKPFGSFPKKKFVHPTNKPGEVKKARKKY